MAWMEFEYGSEALGMKAKCMVLLPQRRRNDVGECVEPAAERYPVLWLLHGASDDYTIWLRQTSIERYVEGMGLAVVMPSAHLSRYANMAHGPRYFDYVAKELPEVLAGVFPLSRLREDNFVAGLSMGGYGAMKVGLTLPEQYAAIGCFSSGNLMRLGTMTMLNQARASGKPSMLEAVYGVTDPSSLEGDPQADLFAMAETAEKTGQALPRIFHACGTEDFLLDNARMTSEWFRARPAFDYTYHEGPGAHTWAFWDAWIQTYLHWLRPGVKA